MRNYRWQVGRRLSNVKHYQPPKINYNEVRQAIDIVKVLIRKETDPFIKSDLAVAGITLNKILLR